MEKCSCCSAVARLVGGVCEICFSGDDPDDYMSNYLLNPHDYDDVE